MLVPDDSNSKHEPKMTSNQKNVLGFVAGGQDSLQINQQRKIKRRVTMTDEGQLATTMCLCKLQVTYWYKV